MARQAAAPTKRGVRRKLYRRKGFWLAVLPLLALLAAAGYLYASPFLRVDTVAVRGASPSQWERIRDASGLEGESMLTADLGAAERRILQVPTVKSVDIQRKWPRQAVVTVEEREPWGYWEVNGHLFTIDAEGVVLDGDLPQLGAPIIRQVASQAPEPGDRVNPDVVRLAAMLQTAIPESFGERAAMFVFNPVSGLSVTTENGMQILLGTPNGVEFKLAVLSEAAELAAAQGLQYSVMDLTHGARAILR